MFASIFNQEKLNKVCTNHFKLKIPCVTVVDKGVSILQKEGKHYEILNTVKTHNKNHYFKDLLG